MEKAETQAKLKKLLSKLSQNIKKLLNNNNNKSSKQQLEQQILTKQEPVQHINVNKKEIRQQDIDIDIEIILEESDELFGLEQQQQQTEDYLSDGSFLAEVDTKQQQQQQGVKGEYILNYYTILDDINILLYLKLWRKVIKRGNPFQEQYIQAYTKIRGRTCESLRGRYNKYLKFLTKENIRVICKEFRELGSQAYLHFEKDTKTHKVFKGVFKSPRNTLRQDEKKSPSVQKLTKKRRYSENLEEIKKYRDKSVRKQRDKPIKKYKSNQGSIKKVNNNTYSGACSISKSEFYFEQKVKNKKVNSVSKLTPIKDKGVQVMELEISGKIQSNQKTPLKDKGVQVTQHEIIEAKIECNNNSTAQIKTFKRNFDISSTLATIKSIIKSKEVQKIDSCEKRIKYLEQFEKENMQEFEQRLKCVKKFNMNLVFGFNKQQTKITLNERINKNEQKVIQCSEYYKKYKKQDINVNIKGFGRKNRFVSVQNKKTTFNKKIIQEYAKTYQKDESIVIQDYFSVSGDFEALRTLYQNNYTHLVWLPYEDQILQIYNPNDTRFRILQHNKGIDNIKKRIKFLGIDKYI